VDRRGVGLGTVCMFLPCATIAKSGHVVRYCTGTRLQVFLTFVTIEILDKKALREVEEKFANSKECNKCGKPAHMPGTAGIPFHLLIIHSYKGNWVARRLA
jgi:hypothetical protein